jgi:hypothetical protein
MRGDIPPLPHYTFMAWCSVKKAQRQLYLYLRMSYIRGPFEKFVDWRQCATVMQREAVTVMPSCNGGGNVVVA